MMQTKSTWSSVEVEEIRQVANEWADMAVNGLQWVRNIIDGISTPEDALANLELNLAQCQRVNNGSAALRRAVMEPAVEYASQAGRQVIPKGAIYVMDTGHAYGAETNPELAGNPNAELFIPAKPVAVYQGHRLTPEGTKEFWGFADEPLPEGTVLYAAKA